MVGQGSPSSLASRFARAWLAICLLATIAPYARAQDRLLEQPVRLRIAWGGQDARRWSGQVAIEGGSFADLRLLGMDADAAGSIWLDPHVIHVDSIAPHRFDGFDVTVAAGDDARLEIVLTDDATTTPLKFGVALADALRQPYRQSLGSPQGELLVQRAPNDALRIETDRETLIFAPGDLFKFNLRPVLDELSPSTTIDVRTTLSPARGGRELPVDEQRLLVPVDGKLSVTIKVPVPTEEGVYTVRTSVSHPPGMRKTFLPIGGTKSIAERTFQIVALRPTPGAAPGTEVWEPVLEIDPANPRWWQRLPQWTQLQRLPGFMPRPLGSLRAGSVNHPLGQFVELPPTASDHEPHWQAYPLPTERLRVPHLLEVEYPADADQHLGLSILEPNAAGRMVPVGRDSGVYVEGLGRAEQTLRHRHRIVFWPRTNSPLLLVTNLHPSSAARFGRIRVSRGGERLAGAERRLPWREAQRLVAAYMSRPLVPELFGATEGLNAASGESVDDWETFMEASERLADYLQYAGYNAAVLNVLADGGSIYPSRRLLSTPLYDTGGTVAGAIDLPDSDPLELLLRVFDREGLALVPSLQLAAPLPELERLRRQTDPQVSGLEWVGGDGRTWLQANGTNRGLAPYYNLLDKRVQKAVLDVTQEIIDRYGRHAALAGLAVQLSGDSFAQLPDLDWGLDDATIAEFERETGVRIAADGPNRFAARQALLAGEHRETWRTWRAARVTAFYSQLAKQLQAAGRERRLLLTTEEMFSSQARTTELRPSLLSPRSRVNELMLDAGIDCAKLEHAPGVVVCAAQLVAPTTPLVDRAIDFEVNEFAAAASRSGAAMFFHQPARRRLASFDVKSGLDSYTLLVTQSSADTAAVRKPLVQALSEGDPALLVSGGELLPMGQEAATRDILRMLQQLPTQADVTVHRQQPVVVRRYRGAGETTCLVVNECPWSVDADVVIDVSANAELEVLCGLTTDQLQKQTVRQRFASGRQVWSVHLEPYGVYAARWSVAGVEVAQVRASVSEGAKAELQAQLANLTGRDLTAPSNYEKLANPGFEPAGGNNPLPGWQVVGNLTHGTVELDAVRPAAGTSCLYLQSRTQPVIVESDSFATPPTGQLAMTVWVRGEHLDPQTELRIEFEADRAGQPYRTYWKLGGNNPGAPPLGSEWVQPFAVGANDLPLDSSGRMRIRFELTGPGEVWIDEVRLYDVLFPLSFYRFTQQETLEFVKLIHAASSAYELNRLADCVRALEGYWSRFLVAYTPLADPAVAKDAPPEERQATLPAEQQPKTEPGRLEWFRDWLPNPFR